MTRYVILVVEDEPEVREAVVRDLAPFEPLFRVEPAEDVVDAREVISQVREDGDRLALILADHLLPGVHGTDFLVSVHDAPEGKAVRKVLLTGQAGHDDTIKAINQADLDHYIAKPWSGSELQQVVRGLLTDFVIDEAADLLPFVAVLDGPRLMERLAERAGDR